MARRKSLLELAKKLRSSTGSSQSGCSPSKSSIKSVEVTNKLKVEQSSSQSDFEELDENGNVIKQTKRQEKSGRRFSDIGGATNSHSTEADSSSKRVRRRRSQQVQSEDGEADSPTSTCRPVYPKLDNSLEEKSWAKTRRQLDRMTNEELQSLLVTDDTRLLDYLIEPKPIIKRLERERAEMKKQVLSLAVANNAREPEFTRDRLKLRAQMEKIDKKLWHIKKHRMKPIGSALEELHEIQSKLARDAMELDLKTESMMKEFLNNGANKTNDTADDVVGAAADCCNLGSTCEPVSASSYEQFIRNYEHIRKDCIKKRILADRLAQERDSLLSNMTYKSLILTGKQPSSALAAEAASIKSTDSFAITSTSGAGATSSLNTKSTRSLVGDTNLGESCSISSDSLLVGSTNAIESPNPPPRRGKRAGLHNK